MKNPSLLKVPTKLIRIDMLEKLDMEVHTKELTVPARAEKSWNELLCRSLPRRQTEKQNGNPISARREYEMLRSSGVAQTAAGKTGLVSVGVTGRPPQRPRCDKDA